MFSGVFVVVAIAGCGGSKPPAQEPTASPPATSTDGASTMKITESMGAMPPAPAGSTAPPPPTAAALEAWWPTPKSDTGGGATVPVSEADRVVAGMRARFRSCHQTLLSSDPGYSGGAPTFAITHVNGEITKVDVLCPAAPKAYAECMSGVVRRSGLSMAGTGQTILGAPCPETPKK